jgi:hypothetical protein
MPDPIDRLRPIRSERRRVARRQDDTAPSSTDAAAGGANLPVPIDQPEPQAQVHPAADAGPSTFAAQLMGQSGQKRGLRGGPPVLEAARSAYLGTEWSGPADRREPQGSVRKTDV